MILPTLTEYRIDAAELLTGRRHSIQHRILHFLADVRMAPLNKTNIGWSGCAACSIFPADVWMALLNETNVGWSSCCGTCCDVCCSDESDAGASAEAEVAAAMVGIAQWA